MLPKETSYSLPTEDTCFSTYEHNSELPTIEKTYSQIEADSAYEDKVYSFCKNLLLEFFKFFSEELEIENGSMSQEELPYVVWDIVVNKEKYADAMPEGERFFLTRLAAAMGGWISYDNGKPKFVSTTVWTKRFNIWLSAS